MLLKPVILKYAPSPDLQPKETSHISNTIGFRGKNAKIKVSAHITDIKVNGLNETLGVSMVSQKGFTLAELLIALTILGVIATFTIPKILQGQQNAQRKSIVKETVASFSQIAYEGYLKGELDTSNYSDYFLTRLNAIKICPNDSEAEGCWDTGTQPHIANHSDYPGMVLANGAYITGVSGYDFGNGVKCSGQYIDWNGTAGPNIPGQDIVEFISSYGIKDTDPSSWCYNIKPGTVEISWSDDEIWIP